MLSTTVKQKCARCGKSADEVGQLVTGLGANICAECVVELNQEIAEQTERRVAKSCSYCHENRESRIFGGESASAIVSICPDCLKLCNQIVAETKKTKVSCGQPAPKEPELTRKKKPET